MRILNDEETYAIKRLNDFTLSINAAYLLFNKVPEMNLSVAKDLEKQINVILELIERLTKDIKIKNKQIELTTNYLNRVDENIRKMLNPDDIEYYGSCEALKRYFEQRAKAEIFL